MAKWQPLERAGVDRDMAPYAQEVLEKVMKDYNLSAEQARKMLDEDDANCEYWLNNIYQVMVRKISDRWVQLNVRRRDGEVVHDWRHLQQIKNELVGPECEAVELYPAESRLVDASNKYHLWACTDPSFRFPIGFTYRDVQYEHTKVPGLKQRPFDKSMGKVKRGYDQNDLLTPVIIPKDEGEN